MLYFRTGEFFQVPTVGFMTFEYPGASAGPPEGPQPSPASGGELVFSDKKSLYYGSHNIKNKWLKFVGDTDHFVKPFKGTRVVVIWGVLTHPPQIIKKIMLKKFILCTAVLI
eukprot:SAG11_NODE_2916_length_2840_cov_13.306457_2_plen_112_part_00